MLERMDAVIDHDLGKHHVAIRIGDQKLKLLLELVWHRPSVIALEDRDELPFRLRYALSVVPGYSKVFPA